MTITQSKHRYRATQRGTIRSILLVDDDVGLANGVRMLLQRHGFVVQTANGGRPALRMLAHEQFDLVITDIFMDDMEGLETIVAIRDRHPEMRVIAVSGGSRMVRFDCLEMAAVLGAETILRKPLTIESLLKAIRALEDETASVLAE